MYYLIKIQKLLLINLSIVLLNISNKLINSNKSPSIEELDKLGIKIWEEINLYECEANKHFDCNRILKNDIEFIRSKIKNRLIYKDIGNPMNCEAIKSRNLFLNYSSSDKEKQFPIAYARIVYKDYRFLEAELATNYHPQNWYCFAVASKADESFYKKIKSLANCFENVVIPKERFSVDSYGHGMGKAHMSCFKELIKKEIKWEYIVTLQNYDIQIKTNEEMVQIFKWLNGACDSDFSINSLVHKDRINRLKENFNWTFESLNLFKNETLNKRFDDKGFPLSLNLATGNVQTSLARTFVNFLVNKLNLNKMLDQLDNGDYASDEFFIQTLLASNNLKAPNTFPYKCIKQNYIPDITKFTIWWYSKEKCYSNKIRHNHCIFGLEDLWHYFYNSKYLFLNKMMPEFDFGAILCLHEEMRKRTLIEKGIKRLNKTNYLSLPQVRFHKEWQRTLGNVDIESFNC